MRIVTRPDFDGIVCAVLLSDALAIAEPVLWVEPNDMQHRLVEVRHGDIIANLAYHENCTLWFDHHESNRMDKPFKGIYRLAPSAAGVVFDYLGKTGKNRFKRDYSTLIEAVDRIDSADLSLDEVLHPENYPYTALSITISSHDMAEEPYWNRLVHLLKTREISEILKDKEVKKRLKKAVEAKDSYVAALTRHTHVYDHVAVSDFRAFDKAPEGNRFIVFSLFPETVVNVRIRFHSGDREKVRISIGHSVFNRGCHVNAGLLCSRFGGGGHRGAGACTVPGDRVAGIMKTILDILIANQPLPFDKGDVNEKHT